LAFGVARALHPTAWDDEFAYVTFKRGSLLVMEVLSTIYSLEPRLQPWQKFTTACNLLAGAEAPVPKKA